MVRSLTGEEAVSRSRFIRHVPLKRTSALRPVSKKTRAQKQKLDAARAEVFERSHGECEARTPVCTLWAEHAHHRKLRSQGGEHSGANEIAVCRACHVFIHARPSLSYERGWLVRSSA